MIFVEFFLSEGEKKEVSGSIVKVKNIIKEEVSECEDNNKGTLLSVFAMFELVWCETVS